MRLRLELVVQRLEDRRLAARAVRRRLRQQPIGEPGVAREQRPVQVRADRAADSTALVAALAVVPESGDHTSERLGALVEDGAPGVVLEPGERPVLARKGALEQDIADHPPLARVGLQREHAGAREVAAVAVAVEAAEELVAAADGERRGAAGDPLAKPFALRSQVVCDQRLLSVLSAADVVEVVSPALTGSPIPMALTSSSRPRAAARRAKTAMFPRSA